MKSFVFFCVANLVAIAVFGGHGNAGGGHHDSYEYSNYSTTEHSSVEEYYSTSVDDCNGTSYYWGDGCAECECYCSRTRNHGGSYEYECKEICTDFTKSVTNSALYRAAYYCDIECDSGYFESIGISQPENESCSCDSIVYSCYNDTDNGESSSGGTTNSDDKYSSNCTAGDVDFDWVTYTSNHGGNTFTKCEACVCMDKDDDYTNYYGHSRDGRDDDTTTEPTTTEYIIDNEDNYLDCSYYRSYSFYYYIARRCNLDCNYDEVDWDENNCGCPTCEGDSNERTTDEPYVNTADSREHSTTGSSSDKETTTEEPDVTDSNGDEDTTTSVDESSDEYTTTEDETIYEPTRRHVDNNDYNDSAWLALNFSVQITRVWDDRSELFYIFRYAVRQILAQNDGWEDISDSVKFIISWWNAFKVEDEETTNVPETTTIVNAATEVATTTTTTTVAPNVRRRRRRSRQLLDEDSEEITVQIEYTLIVFFLDYDDADSWYDFLTGLDTTFLTDYVTNCDALSRNYYTSGFGDITVLSAWIALYDNNGNLVQQDTYDGEETIVTTEVLGVNETRVLSPEEAGDANIISISFISLFVVLVTIFIL